MRALGIILAGGSSNKLGELSSRRAIAAMPIAGGYRSIDFVLSNMSNSHIQKVGVFTQYNAKSLSEHLNSSKWWDFGRKQGGLYVFTPTITLDNGFWYRGTADAMAQNINYLKSSHEPYVVIASGDGIYKLDYNKVLEQHIAKKADVTVVTKELSPEEDASRFGCIQLDQEDRIIGFEEKPILAKTNRVSIGVYIIRRRQLIEFLERAAEEERYDFVKDILIRYKDIKRIYSYNLKEYWSNIATISSYYNTNMSFLNKDIRRYFFREYPDVYSKIEDLPPAKYNSSCQVTNSLVSSGCIVNGEVSNSILFKKAYIGNGSVIKNSIVLGDVFIGDNTYIENCIVESGGTIRSNSRYVGSVDEVELVVENNERYVL